MSNKDFEYMKEAMTADLAEKLSTDLGLNIAESLDVLYNSDTYLKLCNPNTGLYFQSSLYVYSYLKDELSTGKIG